MQKLIIILAAVLIGQTYTEEAPRKVWDVTVPLASPAMIDATTLINTQEVRVIREGDQITVLTFVRMADAVEGEGQGDWANEKFQVTLDAVGWEKLLPTLKAAMGHEVKR